MSGIERSNHIHDGYTCDGYIAALPGLYNEMRFKYRPALLVEVEDLFATSDKLPPGKYARAVSRVVSGKVKEWDLKDQKGVLLPITEDSILSLPRLLWMRFYRIVLGTEATDIDPLWTTQKKNTSDKDEIDALLYGETPGAMQEERQTKN